MSRTAEALRHHFEVERELAARLRGSRREERGTLVPELYAELYRRVPDHPRSSRARDAAAAARAIANQMRLLKPFLTPEASFVELGAGRGGLSSEVASKVRRAVAVEVCAQGDASTAPFPGLEWVFHDGLEIPLEDASFDVAFSYQVLEHIHPDDVPLHVAEVARILKPGGVYVLSTPHAYSGPHDVSRYFTDELETFHLKEWTYAELSALLREQGFGRAGAFVKGQFWGSAGLFSWRMIEAALKLLPNRVRKRLSRKCLNNVIIAAHR